MTSVTGTSERAEASGQPAENWTTRTLFARHKAAGIGGLALLALLLVITVGGILLSRPLVVSDSSSCTAWGSANDTQQRAYARRYVQEHGALPGGATEPVRVLAAVNAGCTQAFENDVQDSLTVREAIRQ